MANGNDIVISAKAQTKEAEDSLKRLDDKIKNLANSDKHIQKAEKGLEKFGKTAKKASTETTQQTTLMMASASALGAGLAGLGAAVIAFGGSAISYAIEHFDDYTDAAKAATEKTKAWSDMVNQSIEETNRMTSSLKQLDELAKGGVIDNDSIQASITLVEQLAKKFGDVGISVDEATGRVHGLEAGLAQINAKNRAAQLNAARAEARAAEKEVDAIKLKHEGENGSKTWYGNTWRDFRLMGKDVPKYFSSIWSEKSLNAMYQEQHDNQKAELYAAKGRAQAARAKVQALEGEVDTEKLAETTNRATASAERKKFDKTGLQLQNNLAAAINSGDAGAIASARQAVDAHAEEMKRKELEALNERIAAAEAEKKAADEDLNKRRRNVQEDKQNARVDRANSATAYLADLIKQREGLLAGIKVAGPAGSPVAGVSTVLDKISTSSNGTFDSRGLGALGQTDVEKQQLEQLKLIAQNTKEDKIPLIGE